FPPEPPREASRCVICTHQRQRCLPECIFAPHFPPSKAKECYNCIKLFTVNGMRHILENMPPQIRGPCIASLIVEAETRYRLPENEEVGGDFGVSNAVSQIHSVQQRIKLLEAELKTTKEQIATLQQDRDWSD
ncbi:hypothetical protein Tsubulata_021051, partial [Turnera subulata]